MRCYLKLISGQTAGFKQPIWMRYCT